MRGRNRKSQYLPAKIVGKITKCRYLPSKIATFEIQKKIDRKYDLGKCHSRPDSEIQKKIDSKYDLQRCHFRPNSEIQKKSTQNTICKSAISGPIRKYKKNSTQNTNWTPFQEGSGNSDSMVQNLCFLSLPDWPRDPEIVF